MSIAVRKNNKTNLIQVILAIGNKIINLQTIFGYAVLGWVDFHVLNLYSVKQSDGNSSRTDIFYEPTTYEYQVKTSLGRE